jgi:hypothetical protein
VIFVFGESSGNPKFRSILEDALRRLLGEVPRFWTRTPSFEQRRGLLSLQSVMDIDEKDMIPWMNVKQNWWELLKWRGKSGVRYECKTELVELLK